MMEPIVSPWFIYFLGIVGGIIGMFGVIGMFSGIAVVITIGISIAMGAWPDDFSDPESSSATVKRVRRVAVPVFLISVLLFVFTPSRNTLIGMYAAKYVTSDNVMRVIGAGQAVKDEVKTDIIDIIKTIQGGDDGLAEDD